MTIKCLYIYGYSSYQVLFAYCSYIAFIGETVLIELSNVIFFCLGLIFGLGLIYGSILILLSDRPNVKEDVAPNNTLNPALDYDRPKSPQPRNISDFRWLPVGNTILTQLGQEAIPRLNRDAFLMYDVRQPGGHTLLGVLLSRRGIPCQFTLNGVTYDGVLFKKSRYGINNTVQKVGIDYRVYQHMLTTTNFTSWNMPLYIDANIDGYVHKDA